MSAWKESERVLSLNEPELGIGQIVKVAAGRLDVIFVQSEVRRRYAAANAPLRRVLVDENESTAERDLGPLELFLRGQWTPPHAFDLRESAWKLKSRALQFDLRGLAGPRVSLLPHQIYIAQELARRPRPRALLADEVGLGKTIEAGLVFASLRALDRANRVLIVVPESLKHQWLAEMYRRFQTLFSLADEETTDFASQQMWIVTLDSIVADPARLAALENEKWDLLIVDEAHHLKWQGKKSADSWYAIQDLSLRSEAMLLLTATPRQQGLETQFGLLHLVDPERFADFETFKQESESLLAVAALARRLEGLGKTSKSASAERRKIYTELRQRFADDTALLDLLDVADDADATPKILDALVDRHGTGRVLFRNRRERLKGFPERKLWSIPLEEGGADARARWLLEFLGKRGKDKVLVLCTSRKDVLALDRFLQKSSGLKRALFHEELDLVERDRQAAWFAQPDGAQVLISSEVGGEGRNFQFCHHLVLYDLPVHPDLVEQRIGRLDRIGQGSRIEIHVPWQIGGAEEVLFRWYHEGLNCFEQSWNGLAALEEKFREARVDVQEYFAGKTKTATKQARLEKLIAETQVEAQRLREEQRESTDHLLDLNSYRPEPAQRYVETLQALEADSTLQDYMESCWDYFGVDQENFDELGTVKVSPGSLMFVDSFPELPDEKVMTFSRRMALAREDFGFITQDHPMVQGSLALLLDQKQGVAGAGFVGGMHSALYFELLFLAQAVASPALEVEKFLAPQLRRVTINHRGERQPKSPAEGLTPKTLPENWIHATLPQLRGPLPGWVERVREKAASEFQSDKKRAHGLAEASLTAEIGRLEALRARNPSVSESEIAALRLKKEKVLQAILAAELRLDAVRMIVVSPEAN